LSARARRRAHQILFFVIVGVLALALSHQLAAIRRPLDAIAFGLTVVYLAWLLSEARITFARRSLSAADGTLLPYALARTGTAVAAVLGPLPWAAAAWWMAVPVSVFLAGITLRLWAIKVLGRFYSHKVMRQQGHTVVTNGPYARVRHPAYSGMLAAHVGFVGFFLNPFSVVGLTLLTAALVRRIRSEETMLMTLPGYAPYAASIPRLLPGVW
jgi:protein-S-isoprenylcysteine O-methyltransferase Ste14